MSKRLNTNIAAAFSGNTLRALVFRGGAWLAAGSMTEQIARFGRNMILARLLAPAAFGTMAIVVSVSSALQAFTDIGVREALIQNPRGSEREYVNAAWWMAFGRALGTYALIFLAAPYVARFYGNPELSALLRVAVLGLLFEGALSAKAYLAMKEMKLSKWALIYHAGGLLGIVITLILGMFMRNVWAIVIGACTESAARFVLSYAVCPYLPELKWNRSAFKDLAKFSRGLFGLSLLNLIFARTDIFVLAKLFPVADLGLYTMAVYLVQVPTGFAIALMGQVFFPMFCKMQGDRARINRVMLQITMAVALLGAPLGVLVLFCAKPMLALVYGHTYMAASTALIAASWVALINLVNVQITGVLYASGSPKLHRRCVAIMAAVMLLLVYPSAKWFGIVGGQFAALVAMSAGFLFQAERIRHVTGFRLKHYARVAGLALGPAAVVAAVCLGYRTVDNVSAPATVGIGMFAGIVAYGLASWIMIREVNSPRDRSDRFPAPQFVAGDSGA